LEPRREIPDPTYHWPSGPGAHDEPTPLESALAALKFGAMLAAGLTIAFIYLGTYAGVVAGPVQSSVFVLAAFILPSLIAASRTAWVRRRRGPR
jgi:hypothetical protein